MAANDVPPLPNKIPYKIRLLKAGFGAGEALILWREKGLGPGWGDGHPIYGVQPEPEFTHTHMENMYDLYFKYTIDDPVFMAAYCNNPECIKEYDGGKIIDLNHYSIRRFMLQPGVTEYELSLRYNSLYSCDGYLLFQSI